jgi:hypothetical protein
MSNIARWVLWLLAVVANLSVWVYYGRIVSVIWQRGPKEIEVLLITYNLIVPTLSLLALGVVRPRAEIRHAK